MAGLVAHNGQLVTAGGAPVHIDLQAAIEAAGPTPAERTHSIPPESRRYSIPRDVRVYSVGGNELIQAKQAPGSLLDHKLDWSGWLGEGETIESSEWLVPPGINLAASTKTDSTATAWIEGGQLGVTYRVTNWITTSENRVDERSILITIERR